MKSNSVQSPCVNICTLDEDSGYCRGCFRTLDEIANWLTIDAQDRLMLLDELERRRADVAS